MQEEVVEIASAKRRVHFSATDEIFGEGDVYSDEEEEMMNRGRRTTWIPSDSGDDYFEAEEEEEDDDEDLQYDGNFYGEEEDGLIEEYTRRVQGLGEEEVVIDHESPEALEVC